jgi:hypothetical protein
LRLCNHTTRTQKALLIDHLATGKKITALDALRIAGTMKASSRMGELEREGHDIQRAWVEKGGKRMRLYWLGRGRKH